MKSNYFYKTMAVAAAALCTLSAMAKRPRVIDNGSVRKAGCNPWYNRVKTLSLPHEAMASITNRIP